MKYIVKGGIWKNTEDEILKAAVSKYGKNQWARISSLLVRKTPKQCKARWFEWLDPSIKKTEWSKEEDEKLLHLAKLMPTQWRTIAPIVGRTPAQCLERYQKLLDEAETRDTDRSKELGLQGAFGHETGPSADDVRKLRPGEVDPEPETKPARPDPVDMDEDEKEMLSEARARLANTQGKKAKRKARERQLEEARRLTALQKRRELKAAGIYMRLKTKPNVMDYNTDVPFEKKPALGFYDTTEEGSRTVDPGKLTNVHLSKLNRRRADIEEEKNREKKRKARENNNKGGPQGNQGQFVPEKNAKIQKMQEEEQIAKRRKLVLPAPQVGEQELEEIVKSGFAGENAKTLVADDVGATPFTDRGPTPLYSELRTPRPKTQVDGYPGATPLQSMATPRNAKPPQSVKVSLLQGLASLPKPRNEWEIRLPEIEQEDEKKPAEKAVEDMSDLEREIKEQAERDEQERAARRSLAVQLELPRPTTMHQFKAGSNASEAEKMIYEELNRLLKHDAVKYPVAGGKVAPGAVQLPESIAQLEDEFDSKALADARKELDQEIVKTLGLSENEDVKKAVWEHVSSKPEFEELWKKEHDELIFSVKFNRFLTLNEMDDDKDIIQGLEKTIEANRQTMIRDATRAGKLENKLEVRLGGYMNRSKMLSKQIVEAFEEYEAAQLEYNSFLNLQNAERAVIPRRIEALEYEVNKLVNREKELQERYKNLSDEKMELLV
ncbi:Pre-mRNA-splicing factor cef1 [Rhizopus azygosporus]|uniref:Pre-mRNA-splicing factor cef1 n=1 Tax=Rhizopus azygosporus TaxID=86630 RepID=A0A367JI40_RHIAZ|nr:Pre-mRNA-splicing factor cef1 [Rhizopus azygosporus]